MSSPTSPSSAPAPGRAAVIGSGFGGLGTAIRLQAAGVPTTLFEARDKPGGRAYVYEQDGYVFDAGPTVITAPESIEELFQVAGRRMADYVELLPVEPFYRLAWADGRTFDYGDDTASLHKQIAAFNPDDVAGYERFLAYSKKVFAAGYGELVHTPFLRFRDMVRVAPKLVGLGAYRSVYGAVSRFVEDEHLRQALSFHSLLIGGSPFEASAIYTLIHHLERSWGVHFPRGGTGALVQGLVRLFQDLGGTVHLNTPVERLEPLPDGGARVHTEGGAGVSGQRFDAVVSNADVHHTYAHLLRDHPRGPKRARALERKQWSMSLFVLYFGTDRPYRDEVAHHTILFGPRYRELIDEIFHGHALPEDFSLYLHAPTVTDPSLAPAGGGTFYALAPVPNLAQADLDWDEVAPRYAEKILAALEDHLPDLRAHVVIKHWSTPKTFRDDLRSYAGAGFSLAPTLTQSAWFRPHNRDAKLPWLYFAGAGTHPGAGVPGVLNAGKATSALVLEDLGVTGQAPATAGAARPRVEPAGGAA